MPQKSVIVNRKLCEAVIDLSKDIGQRNVLTVSDLCYLLGYKSEIPIRKAIHNGVIKARRDRPDNPKSTWRIKREEAERLMRNGLIKDSEEPERI